MPNGFGPHRARTRYSRPSLASWVPGRGCTRLPAGFVSPRRSDFAGAPSLALANDWLGARPMDEHLTLAGRVRFASEIEADAVSASDGPIPVANVLAFDAPRTPRG